MSAGRYSSPGSPWTSKTVSRESRETPSLPFIEQVQKDKGSFALGGIVAIAHFLEHGFQRFGEKEFRFPFIDISRKEWLLALVIKKSIPHYSLSHTEDLSRNSAPQELTFFRQNSACIEFHSLEERVTIWKRDTGIEVIR